MPNTPRGIEFERLWKRWKETNPDAIQTNLRVDPEMLAHGVAGCFWNAALDWAAKRVEGREMIEKDAV